jgi:PAS domain S-box-containing protein
MNQAGSDFQFRRVDGASTQPSQHSEESIGQSEAFFDQVFEKNVTVQLLIDVESGAIARANASAVQFYGYDRPTLQQMTISDLAEYPHTAISPHVIHMALVHPGQFLFRHRLASGTVRDVEVHSSMIDLWGRPLLHSIIHDITERKQATEASQHHD